MLAKREHFGLGSQRAELEPEFVSRLDSSCRLRGWTTGLLTGAVLQEVTCPALRNDWGPIASSWCERPRGVLLRSRFSDNRGNGKALWRLSQPGIPTGRSSSPPIQTVSACGRRIVRAAAQLSRWHVRILGHSDQPAARVGEILGVLGSGARRRRIRVVVRHPPFRQGS